MDWQKIISDLTADALVYAPKIALALVVIIVGFWLAKRISKTVKKILKNRDTDEALISFGSDLVNILIKALVVISAAGIVGIETTSFIAILGAAGLAIGLALQGSLGNFAGGVLILIFKPFRVGDLIDAQGHIGHVRAINVFVTTLESPDSKTVILPNGPLSNGSVTNLSTLGKLRVDLVVGIGYGENIQAARDAIMEVMKNDPQVLNDPAPSVNVLELADSSINLAVRPYATPADYWDVYFGIQEKAKNALDQVGIEIPFPQRVIHQAPTGK